MRLAEIERSEHIDLFFFQTVTLRLVVLECFPHRQPHSMTEIHSCSGHMAAPAFVVGVPAVLLEQKQLRHFFCFQHLIALASW